MSQRYRLARRRYERARSEVASEPALSHNQSRFGTTTAQRSDWGVHLPKAFDGLTVDTVDSYERPHRKTVRSLLGQLAAIDPHERSSALGHPLAQAVLAAAHRLNVDLPRQLA